MFEPSEHGFEGIMIVSHKHKFIFLKTAKTAGTSIEIALSKFVGDQDIVTPISAADEQIRRSLGYRGPQNFRVPCRQHSAVELCLAALRGRRKSFYNHMTADEARTLIGENIWNSYYKFCFERNPFDRVISLYYWCHKQEPRPTISQFIDGRQIELLSLRGLGVYTTGDGQIAVDKVGRYESLVDDLEEIRRTLGLSEPLNLPHAKAFHRKNGRHYSEDIDEHCRRKIEARFRREIELWNYQF
jgi:hypothetical protein